MAYKTPGVYIEERSIFPPSVAQVETAIPAFIGYTEKAEDRARDDLHAKPKKVSSLLDFRHYFGGPPPLKISTVQLDGNNALARAEVNPNYYMFDSLQLFFLNGGGDCYIISVGRYGDSIVLGDRSNPVVSPGLDVGLAELEKVDEPTIILFPDAVLLSTAADLYKLQKNALAQCQLLGDRVAVFDLRERDDSDNFDWTNQKNEFRKNIGTSFLRYGAAYSPHLRTSLPKTIRYRNIRNNSTNSTRFTRSGAPITLASLTAEAEIVTLIGKLDQATDDVDFLQAERLAMATSLQAAPFNIPPDQSRDLRLAFEFLYNRALSNNTNLTAYRELINYLYNIVVLADGWFWDATANQTSAEFKAEAVTNIFPVFDSAVTELIAFDKGADQKMAGAFNRFLSFDNVPAGPGEVVDIANYTADWTDAGAPPDNVEPFTGANDAERRMNSLPTLANLFQQLIAPVDALVSLGDQRMKTLEDSLLERFPTYKNLIDQLNRELSTLPPSGAIAGVYAQVDRTRGVWKAPANVSLNGVSDLTYRLSLSESDDLNVDVQFGKSINAIRYMTGMGFMVWGARTLAGNDNEWRYISVRRFFNMAEESIKKSTAWAVFEPNDAGTWIKVKGMIENFLILQWRAGALQGAKPEEAFFVKVGLGETMTSVDILEGRMNVEIGMAVVRPAEFIILTFTHKMVGAA